MSTGLISREEALAAGVASIGAQSYGDFEILRFPGETTRVSIGSYCSIGAEVRFFLGGNHRTDWITTFPLRAHFGLSGAYTDGHPESKGDITLGSDVWIGAGATIMSGVDIGHGAVIGARAMVASDVRPYAVVVGNPARETRRRFSDPHVEALLRIAWWEWPEDMVRERVGDLSDGDVGAFCRRYGGT